MTDSVKASENHTKGLSRRKFLAIAGTVALSAGIGSCSKDKSKESLVMKKEDLGPDAQPCMGYLLVDTKKCQGCVSCMMACTLAHHGVVNFSLSQACVYLLDSLYQHGVSSNIHEGIDIFDSSPCPLHIMDV